MAVESIAAELRAHAEFADLFAAIGAAHGEDGVYLVGGGVRDVLLGRSSLDVDVVVEGDGPALARELGRRLGGRVVTHRRFRTATLVLPDGTAIDVVTARRERYAHPGALPEIEPAAIADDLFRRDFAVNAMAASLAGADFGRIVDPYAGRADLAAGVVRVLHDRSFEDDPTRLFRALRYECRLGFRMDTATESLARAAGEEGVLGQVTGARITEELAILLSAPHAGAAIRRLGELGLTRGIADGLRADEEAVRIADAAGAAAAAYGLDVPAWRASLAALARDLDAAAVRRLGRRLRLKARDDAALVAAVDGARAVAAAVERASSPSEIVAAAGRGDPDAPLLAYAATGSEKLRRYLESLRGVRLEITGADIGELGLGESPEVGRILAELRRRKLDGELAGRDAELAAARRLVQSARREGCL